MERKNWKCDQQTHASIKFRVESRGTVSVCSLHGFIAILHKTRFNPDLPFFALQRNSLEDNVVYMGKRDHARINGPTEAHRSRPKRRRESAETASDGDVSMSDLVSDEYDDGEENSLLQQQATKMWQTVKDTVKE